jgi:hypothetical protein
MASNKKDLKAYVRYDGTGRLISGSLILQRFKPKVGNWKRIQAYECCDPFIESGDFLLLEDSTLLDQNLLLQQDEGRIIL